MTTDLELPIFRPRMGGGPGSRSSVDGTRSFRNALLARIRARGSRAARTQAQVHPLQANARRVVIKAHVQRMGPNAAKAAALHVRYIERDGVEKDGWAAVNHFDTSHPHAHVVVRGIDRDGRELRIARGYISTGMRS